MLHIKRGIEKHHFRFVDFPGNDTFNTLKKHLIYCSMSVLFSCLITPLSLSGRSCKHWLQSYKAPAASREYLLYQMKWPQKVAVFLRPSL